MASNTIGGYARTITSNAGAEKAVKRISASKSKSINTISKGSAASAGKTVAQTTGFQRSSVGTKGKRASTGTGRTNRNDNNSDIWREPWRYNRDGSRKTFDELSTPEVLTWISTLPQQEQQSAAEQFEREYLKNPASTRYDPYYTSYSNNDAARQMFGVDTFDQEWIDANRGYASYLTFTNESYTTPKKPGKNASRQEVEAYAWWQIANTYEATTQAAESEYTQLRADVQETIRTMRAAGEKVDAQAVMDGIDWSEYKTLENLREASAAGNGRMLNRPVQVGDESIRSMIGAAARGEDITQDQDWVMGESEYIRSRPTTVKGALDRAVQSYLQRTQKGGAAAAQATPNYADVTSVDYDPYYGEGSNNQSARELFGAEQFDQEWIDANRGLMAYIQFKDEDDQTPIKPGDDASENEKKAYQYWLIANTYEETTREGEKELAELEAWMQKRASYLGEGATAEEIVEKIDWDEYPTLQNMRETAAAGNARMVNRAVHAGDASILQMARQITGEEEAAQEDEKKSGSGGMTELEQAKIDALSELIESLPEGSEERAAAEQEREGLQGQMASTSEEAAKKGNELAWTDTNRRFGEDAKTRRSELFPYAFDVKTGEITKKKSDEDTAAENKAKAQAALASQQAALERIEEGREDVRADAEAKKLTEIFGTTETAAVEAAEYNEYVGSMRANYGLQATINYVKRQIAQLEISDETGSMTKEQEKLLAEYEEQRELLAEEQAQRALIEERVYEALRYGETNYWGDGVLAYIKNRDFADAKSDGEMVPLDQYEAYLQYRMTPGVQWGDEVLSVRSEMAKYDQRDAATDRAALILSGFEEGSKSANNAIGMGAAENITYWLKTRDPKYQGLTREEIYAIDYDLQNFRAWNSAFEGNMDAETKAQLSEEYPVFALISTGISEVMKMGNQSAVGGVIGQSLQKLGGNTIMQGIGRYVPFGLDAYSGSFETAISEGATADQAMLAGVINGAVTGTLSSKTTEWMAGVGNKLFGRLFSSPTAQKAAQSGAVEAAKNGWGNALLSLFKTAVGEGIEEAIEEPIQSGISKAVYDRDRAWVGEGGVFDAKAMLRSGLSGAVAGGMFPVASGVGSAIGAAKKSRRQTQIDAQTEQRINVAAQHVFEVVSCASGELGEAAQAKANDIITRIASGETVADREFDELAEIAARNASIEDGAEVVVEQNAGEIEAAKEKARQTEEAAQSAAQKATEAQDALDSRLNESKPMIKAINEGTASYADPEVAKQIGEKLKEAKAAKSAADAARADADKARADADKAAQEAADTEAQIKTAAREEAAAQVDGEMEKEKAEEAAAREEAKKKLKIRPKGKAQPGVKEMHGQELTEDQQTQLRVLDALGREYGIEFDIVDTLGGANAMYNRAQSKVITVALDASEQAYVQAGAHEMVHYVREQFEDGYTDLKEIVLQALKKNGVDDAMLEYMIDERIEQYRQSTGQELSREDATEEIVAETVPTVFADEDAMAELVKRNRTLVERLRDFFVEFSAKLREIAERYMERNSRMEIAHVINDAESLREIAYALDDALFAAGGGESELRGSVEDGVKFSAATETAGESEGTEAAETASKGKKAEKSLGARIVRKYKSDVSRGKVEAAIAEITDAYNNGDSDEAEEKAAQIAREIAQESRSAVDAESAEEAAQRETLREQYAETRKMLQTTGISLTEVQKQETANAYGSYNEWRRSMMGNVLIKNDGISLDALWGELSGMHPEMFPADTGEAQMPEVLSRFIEQVRPGKKVIDGMDAGTMAAAISLEIQGAVLSAINKEAESVSAQMAAEALKDKGRQRAALKREAQREARRAVMQEIAGEIRAAREAKDDAALNVALRKYRETMGNSLKEMNAAGIIELGAEVRAKEQEISRLKRQIALLSDAIEGEDMSEDREGDVDRRRMSEELLQKAEDELRALHRQQMIERGKMRLKQDGTEGEADPMLEMADEIAQEDLKDTINRISAQQAEQINAFYEQMREKQPDFSMTSTLETEDIENFFGYMLDEMQQNSEMAKEYGQMVSGWKYQLESEQAALKTLKKRLERATASTDSDRINAEIREARDRIDVLNSHIKNGQAEAQRMRRMGAQSMAQALREGKLSQPIMEWVIGACAQASRKNNWFNKQTLVKGGLEAIRLNTTTAARVWDDLFGDAAPIMRAIYYDPVMDNETERQKWIKAWRERISALKLTPQESKIVQMVGEGKATLTVIDDSSAKVQQAVGVFKEFYTEAYQMADKALVRNGYSHLGHIDKYFPHIAKPETIWEKLGIPLEESSLPTSINGLTETFSPGHQYSSHMEERKGDLTDFDALFGFEEYIGTMSNVIFHTDDVQRHRQLEGEIRTAAKEGVFGPGRKGRETTHLSEFVKWVHEYTNQLAGKKAFVDRSLEGTAGRTVYRAAMGLKSVKGASAVCGNIASSITNVIPVQQVMGEHPVALLKAVGQLVFENAVGNSNLAKSSYMVRRFGSDSVNQTLYTKFTSMAGKPFNLVDVLATKLVVNTYYQANLDMGMDSETAMRSADAKAARLMGDRSKGAMPTVYGSQVLGLFTQFQYEVANQSQHFRKDIWRGKSGKEAWCTLIGTMLTGLLWNQFIAEPLTGRRSAADPLNMAWNIVETWREGGKPLAIAQAMYNNVSEMMPYMSGGGRIAAFEGFTEVWDAFTAEDATFADVAGTAADELIFGMLPAGGQVKKTISGIKSVAEGGVYNAKGTQLRYALDWSNLVQAAIFGPGATKQGQAYYSGEAPGLNQTQTGYYEQARERGYGSVEAYRNEAAKAQAKTLKTAADKAESEHEDAQARLRAGLEVEKEADLSQVESQREEARELRSEAMPGEELNDYWWKKREEPTVQEGIKLWRETGETWALPADYNEESTFEVNGRKEYAGAQIAQAANDMYAEGYFEILSGIDMSRMDEDGRAEIRKQLEKLKREVDARVRAEIAERGE